MGKSFTVWQVEMNIIIGFMIPATTRSFRICKPASMSMPFSSMASLLPHRMFWEKWTLHQQAYELL
jgi:hypothetical protein